MNQPIESKNKALVLDAFDTLFNKRYYAAAERDWSPDYIQNAPHGVAVLRATITWQENCPLIWKLPVPDACN